MSEEGRPPRRTPINELDFQLMTVESEWGKDIQPELYAKLKVAGHELEQTTDGKFKVKEEALWGLLSYYTRDMRLGNLDKHMYEYACLWLDFAGDSLRLGAVRSFLTALSRVITALELSQSRGGFLRRLMNTFRQEHDYKFNDDKAKGLFGPQKKGSA